MAVPRALSAGGLSDADLAALLSSDPERGWRAFVEQHTPTMLALIERAGIVDEDEAMDIYVRACERLSEDRCARLRRRDPDKGPLAAWLAAVLRNVMVDWVRSRAGRRRMFAAVERLERRDQRVFELYYWQEQTPAAIAQALGIETGAPVDLAEVFESLERIHECLSHRHRSELLSLVARSNRPLSLEAPPEDTPIEPADPGASPERQLRIRQLEEALRGAIAALPPEDAAIVRLRFVQGLSHTDIQRLLRLDELPDRRLRRILRGLRELLSGRTDRAAGALSFLEDEPNSCT